MKIKLDVAIKNAIGLPFKDGTQDLTIGAALSTIMSYDKEAGRHKGYILAKKFMDNEKEVTLDSADIALIKRAIEKTEAYNTNYITGFLVDVLENAKEENTKEEKK